MLRTDEEIRAELARAQARRAAVRRGLECAPLGGRVTRDLYQEAAELDVLIGALEWVSCRLATPAPMEVVVELSASRTRMRRAAGALCIGGCR